MALDDDVRDTVRAAEDVASGLFAFVDGCARPAYAAEITGTIGELFGVSAALRALNDAHDHDHDPGRRASRLPARLAADLDFCLHNLRQDLRTVLRQFERLGITPDARRPEAYARVWREIQLLLRDGARDGLLDILRRYRAFLEGLAAEWRGLPPPHDMPALHEAIMAIQRAREDRVHEALSPLTLADRDPEPLPTAPATTAAFVGRVATRPRPRRRSPTRRTVPSPMVERPPSPGPGPEDEDDAYAYAYTPPEAPDLALLSPTTTLSSGSSASSAARRRHWTAAIFDGRRGYPLTPFSSRAHRSRCLGSHVEEAEALLEGTSDLLAQLELDHGALIVRLYLNRRDQRARILCLSADSDARHAVGGRLQSWSSIGLLRITRAGGCLRLSHEQDGGVRRLWAQLSFACYERLVLFFCTLVALRAQGPPERWAAVDGDDGEEVLAQYDIDDDHFLHKLAIRRDLDSGAVRLEATVPRGELCGAPVWTAFGAHRSRQGAEFVAVASAPG
ncbi:MAG: hypothetical protein M1826_002891 [Phylliscum demangeonii]|nr:MAG: hypothetical protein M1826_002891 [Phylliscum demangeonii]